jgi:ABC-type dipeptide/oligopeptide/nickel transport system ATPase component
MQMLHVEQLSVRVQNNAELKTLVDNASFELYAGKTLALVGESGSGKTTLTRALTRLFPPSMKHALDGTVRLNGTELLSCSEITLRDIRRTQIRYVFQEPQQALNPLLTIKKQMKLASGSDTISGDAIQETLHSVGLENAHDIMRLYPHQLSIGMAQRVMIAMAILPRPSLLIADEPTSAVDASLRLQLLDLLKSLQIANGMAMILVTHDLAVTQRYADDIAVMHNGRIVECSSVADFFRQPSHAYSQLLLNTTKSLHQQANA